MRPLLVLLVLVLLVLVLLLLLVLVLVLLLLVPCLLSNLGVALLFALCSFFSTFY